MMVRLLHRLLILAILLQLWNIHLSPELCCWLRFRAPWRESSTTSRPSTHQTTDRCTLCDFYMAVMAVPSKFMIDHGTTMRLPWEYELIFHGTAMAVP